MTGCPKREPKPSEFQRRGWAEDEIAERYAKELRSDQPTHGPAVWQEMDEKSRIRREVYAKYDLPLESTGESK